jgi:hypothetical protein
MISTPKGTEVKYVTQYAAEAEESGTLESVHPSVDPIASGVLVCVRKFNGHLVKLPADRVHVLLNGSRVSLDPYRNDNPRPLVFRGTPNVTIDLQLPKSEPKPDQDPDFYTEPCRTCEKPIDRIPGRKGRQPVWHVACRPTEPAPPPAKSEFYDQPCTVCDKGIPRTGKRGRPPTKHEGCK